MLNKTVNQLVATTHASKHVIRAARRQVEDICARELKGFFNVECILAARGALFIGNTVVPEIAAKEVLEEIKIHWRKCGAMCKSKVSARVLYAVLMS